MFNRSSTIFQLCAVHEFRTKSGINHGLLLPLLLRLLCLLRPLLVPLSFPHLLHLPFFRRHA